MSLFPLRGSTALVAISLALTLPAGITLAQDTASSEVETQEWEVFTRFGVTFSVPPGVPVIRDASDTFVATNNGENNGPGTSVFLREWTSALLETAPEVGTDAFTAFLSDEIGVTLTATGRVIRAGGRDLYLYEGSTSDMPEGAEPVERRVLALITHALDEDGVGLSVSMVNIGLGAAVSGELELEFLDSLRGTEDEGQAAIEPEAPEGGDSDETEDMPEDGASDQGAEVDAAPPVAASEPSDDSVAEAPEVAVTEVAPDEPVAAGEPDTAASEDPEALVRAALAQIDALPAPSGTTPEGWQRYERLGFSFAAPAETLVSVDSASPRPQFQVVSLVDGGNFRTGISLVDAASLAFPPGTPGFLDFISADIGFPSMVAETPIQIGDRSLYRYASAGLAPNGLTLHHVYLVDAEPDAAGNLAVISMQFHELDMDQTAPLVSQVIGSFALAEPEVQTDAPAESLTESPTEAPIETTEPASPSDDLVTEALAALVTQFSQQATVPPDWQSFDRFGVTIAVPAEATVVHDAAPGQPRQFSLRQILPGQTTQINTMVGVVEGESFPEIPHTPEFRAAVESDSGAPTLVSEEPIMIGDRAMRLYVSVGLEGGEPDGAPIYEAYLLDDEADAAGDYLVIGLSSKGNPIDAVAEIAAQTLASLQIEPQSLSAAPAPAEDSDATPYDLVPGLVSLILPEGALVSDTVDGGSVRGLALADEASAETPFARVAAGTLDRPIGRLLRNMIHAPDAVTEGEIDGIPVWMIYAPSRRGMDNGRTEVADGIPAQIILPQACDGDGQPVFMVAMMAHPGQDDRLDALHASLRLTVPEGASDCPPGLVARIEQAMAGQGTDDGDATRPEAPQVEPVQPVEPSPSPSLAVAEAEAWQRAQAIGTPEAVLAYLAQYPRGLHSGEARSWLHARDIYAPDERRPMPAEIPQPPEPQPLTDAQGWQIALADGRAEGLWTYLKAFPQGAHVQEARAMLARMGGAQPVPQPAPQPVPQPVPEPAAPMPGRPDPRPMKP